MAVGLPKVGVDMAVSHEEGRIVDFLPCPRGASCRARRIHTERDLASRGRAIRVSSTESVILSSYCFPVSCRIKSTSAWR